MTRVEEGIIALRIKMYERELYPKRIEVRTKGYERGIKKTKKKKIRKRAHKNRYTN